MQAQYKLNKQLVRDKQLVRGLLCYGVIVSLCTLNSDTLGDSMTLSSGKRSRIEAVRYLGNDEDDLCASNHMQMKMFAVQDEDKEEDVASILINHKKRPARLHITAVKRHVSNIELEEIPEESQ